jgi:hypothetical protein
MTDYMFPSHRTDVNGTVQSGSSLKTLARAGHQANGPCLAHLWPTTCSLCTRRLSQSAALHFVRSCSGYIGRPCFGPSARLVSSRLISSHDVSLPVGLELQSANDGDK